MALTLNQHRFGVTQELIETFKDSRAPKTGLSTFFKKKTTAAKQVSIQVRRSRQLVAVDVQRCTDSNRNIFSLSAEKIFLPPFYSEYFDFTACQAYDVTFGMGVVPNSVQLNMLQDSAQEYLMELKEKIDRAINKMYASVLQTGTVTMVNGDSIDYKRKAASLPVNTGGAAWSSTSTSDPLADLSTDAQFLRDEGLSSGSVINVIMGKQAFNYFMNSAKILAVAAIFNQIKRINIGFPQFDETTGMNFQGQIGGTDYTFNIWTYNDSYENADTTKSKYINDANYIMIPDDFQGTMVYAGLPFVFGDYFSGMYVANTEGDYIVHDVIDQKKRSWEFFMESAPLPIPISIDRIVTRQTY